MTSFTLTNFYLFIKKAFLFLGHYTHPKFANDLFSRFYLTFYSYLQPVGLFFFFMVYFFMVHHYKNSLSSLHIFVHHCTFCASLHVKTIPANRQFYISCCQILETSLNAGRNDY